MLDEPTAGMSNTETEHAVALIHQVSEGRTLVMVEHDMSVVFRPSPTAISVLVYGQIIATGAPTEIRANQAVRENYLGEDLMAALLEVQGLNAYYGKSHFGVDFPRGGARSSLSYSRNGGPLDHDQGDHGRRAAAGSIRFRVGRSARPQNRIRSRASASAMCPRTATSSGPHRPAEPAARSKSAPGPAAGR